MVSTLSLSRSESNGSLIFQPKEDLTLPTQQHNHPRLPTSVAVRATVDDMTDHSRHFLLRLRGLGLSKGPTARPAPWPLAELSSWMKAQTM